MDYHAHRRRLPKMSTKQWGTQAPAHTLDTLAVGTQGRGPSAGNGVKMTLLATPLLPPLVVSDASALTPDTAQRRATDRHMLRARPALPAGACALHLAGGPRERSCSRELLEPRPSDPHSRCGVGESQFMISFRQPTARRRGRTAGAAAIARAAAAAIGASGRSQRPMAYQRRPMRPHFTNVLELSS